jgi:hypothetical protein
LNLDEFQAKSGGNKSPGDELEVETKVELPHAFPFGFSSILIAQSESKLDDLQEVDVAT